MITYICPLCGTEGISMDDTKTLCPYCGNGKIDRMPKMSFTVYHIGHNVPKKNVDTTAKRGIMEAEEKSCR